MCRETDRPPALEMRQLQRARRCCLPKERAIRPGTLGQNARSPAGSASHLASPACRRDTERMTAGFSNVYDDLARSEGYATLEFPCLDPGRHRP